MPTYRGLRLTERVWKRGNKLADDILYDCQQDDTVSTSACNHRASKARERYFLDKGVPIRGSALKRKTRWQAQSSKWKKHR